MDILKKITMGLAATAVSTTFAFAGEITIATVNNGHMIEMQKLTAKFEEANPDIKVKWVTLEEGVLRQRVTTDISTKGGQFDIMTIGMYEAPIWGKRGWLEEMKFSDAYDVEDILPSMRAGLSYDGKLYAAPFYGESSMVMYRKDLLDAAGMKMPEYPSWGDIYLAAEAMTDKDKGQYGVCLRGKPGWGDNMAIIGTMANSFGARWFDENWNPQLNSPAWNHSVSFYVDMMKKFGPPGSSSNSFNEILALFNEGKCGIWVDATIAASFITDPKQSKVADKVAFAQAPSALTNRGTHWLWAWSLAIPTSTKNKADAQKFVEWSTSKEYIELVAETNGWGAVPTGTRQSTYDNAEFIAAAGFANAELTAILSADPSKATLYPTPYKGIQFVPIPEFQAIGVAVGQQMTAALTGKTSVREALEASNVAAEREMKKAGYIK